MSQYFFRPLSFQAACNRYQDCMERMDKVIGGSRSLMDMTSDEADEALVDALESRLHQKTVAGNLVAFAKEFSDGKVNPDLAAPVRQIVLTIYEKREAFRSLATKAQLFTMALCLGAGVLLGAGLLRVWQKARATPAPTSYAAVLKISVPNAQATVERLPDLSDTVTWKLHDWRNAVIRLTAEVVSASGTAKADTVSGDTVSGDTVSGTAKTGNGGVVGWVVIAFLGAAGAVALAAKNALPAKPSNSSLCSQEEAKEVWTLIECLAEIYRNERDFS